MALATAKICASCGAEKPGDEFYVKRDAGSATEYLSSDCKPCAAQRLREWRAARREQHGFDPYHVEKTYGVTVEVYNEMLERQGGVCAICRDPETVVQQGTIRGLSVDHDHATGAVRGLLCVKCNTLLGAAGDDPDRLLAATTYLKEHN